MLKCRLEYFKSWKVMYIFHNYSLFLEIVSFSIIRNFATLVSQRKSVIGRYFYAVSQFC